MTRVISLGPEPREHQQFTLPGIGDFDFALLISHHEVRRRVEELADEIIGYYRERLPPNQPLHLIVVLKGAVTFGLYLSQAFQQRNFPFVMDYLGIGSYNGMQSSGEVRFNKDVDQPLTGVFSLVVEDIIDTRQSMKYILKMLQGHNPASLKVAALLDKPARAMVQIPIAIDFVGFTIPNVFVVGEGLDYEQYLRALKGIWFKVD